MATELYRTLSLPRISDPRGNLTFAQCGTHLPFTIERAYWLYDVPAGEARGGHAHRRLEQLFVALAGSFDLVIDDGLGRRETVTLNRPFVGIYMPPLRWRELENFSSGGVCLVLASRVYEVEDYIRDFDVFRAEVAP